jgi:hypothetical protein
VEFSADGCLRAGGERDFGVTVSAKFSRFWKTLEHSPIAKMFIALDSIGAVVQYGKFLCSV